MESLKVRVVRRWIDQSFPSECTKMAMHRKKRQKRRNPMEEIGFAQRTEGQAIARHRGQTLAPECFPRKNGRSYSCAFDSAHSSRIANQVFPPHSPSRAFSTRAFAAITAFVSNASLMQNKRVLRVRLDNKRILDSRVHDIGGSLVVRDAQFNFLNAPWNISLFVMRPDTS